ncbi:DUF3179 domain-containing (seleno)protein [Pollutibacter soli]|uniref:DUF3179 domain-containing (seleno)protein n=1 Tax=Pollutibacter soli TaxID=3034157 RepID=UPI0030141155
MKKLFFFGILGLILFEIANVFFIMPMPGSQRMNSIDLAYFLYRWRWAFRVLFAVMIIVGLLRANWKRKWVPAVALLPLLGIAYMFNFVMSADHMFYQPSHLIMKTSAENKTDTARVIIGVTNNGEAKAYPVQYIGYHHQVMDTVGGKPLIITYCTVCRTGRVYEPLVNGQPETFRLVGMDHFNAMFEDKSTGSWWRQVNGEAIAGKMKGTFLPTVLHTQTSLKTWLSLYPDSYIMQPDPDFVAGYDSTFKYESGKSKSSLTGTDSLSWKDKSWVVGVKNGANAKAYDWNMLKEKRLIQDIVGQDSLLLLLANDDRSFFVFRKPMGASVEFLNDTLKINGKNFRLDGKGIDTTAQLQRVLASQEFWHSWKTFYPETKIYE